jgi:hypothetical protein
LDHVGECFACVLAQIVDVTMTTGRETPAQRAISSIDVPA